MNTLKSKQMHEFPKVIKDLPEADLPFKGARAWILQGGDNQLIFFEFQPDVNVPEHSHSYAQWGMVVQGKMKLSIDGKMRLYQKGDDYLIPAGAKHGATFKSKARVIDLFSEKARYKAKKA